MENVKEFLQLQDNYYDLVPKSYSDFFYDDGCGDGCGCNSGENGEDGCGCGWGIGNGSGDSVGCGDGDGNSFGYGRSNGCGNSYDYFDPVGDFVDDRYGDVEKVNDMDIYTVDQIQTIITHVNNNIAKGYILKSDLTLESCYVVKQNNLFAHGKTVKEAIEALHEKLFDDMPQKERIKMFLQEFKLNKKYPAKMFYEWHHKLTGSCFMGRNVFVKEHGIDIEHDMMTVERFIELTKNEYGGGVIMELEKACQKCPKSG